MNGLGLPVKLTMTPGQAADMNQAKTLIDSVPLEMVIADKGYDSKDVVTTVEIADGEAVIPSRSNATAPRKFD